MKNLLILLGLALASTLTFAQGGSYLNVTSIQGAGNVVRVIQNAPVVVCNYPGTGGTPCTNKATTYTDTTLGTPCGATTQVVTPGTSSCTATSDSAGNFGFYVANNTYVYYFQDASAVWHGPYTVAVGVVFNGQPVSLQPANTSDTIRFNDYGDSKWDIVSALTRFIYIFNDVTTGAVIVGHGDAAVVLGTQAGVASSGTESPSRSYTSSAVGSVNVTAGVRWGWAAGLGADAMSYGPLRRFSMRLIMNNTTNARYWVGLTDGATGDFAGGSALASDAPNRKYAAFRFSSGTDTTIKAVAATSNVLQTVVDTGVVVDTVNSKLFEIVYTGTSFKYYLDGVLVATISTNIPAATDRFGMFWCSDNKNTATAVGATFFHAALIMK